MFLAPCNPKEAAAERSFESDDPFKYEQPYHEQLLSWLQLPTNFCPKPYATQRPTQQNSKDELMECRDGPLAPTGIVGFGPQQLSHQMEPFCGDLGENDRPDGEVELKEGGQEPVVLLEYNGRDQPTKVEQAEDGHEGKQAGSNFEVGIESEAHAKERVAPNKFNVNGERKAEQQVDVHSDGLREFRTMLAEDFESWWIRECQQASLTSAGTVPSSPSKEASTAAPTVTNAGLGRVILEARLSCKDEAGNDVVLEQRLIQVHLFQREKDAARCFLEECNGLAPQLVCRYFQPLTSWLQDGVQAASSEIACKTRKVDGDLEHIARWYQSQV